MSARAVIRLAGCMLVVLPVAANSADARASLTVSVTVVNHCTVGMTFRAGDPVVTSHCAYLRLATRDSATPDVYALDHSSGRTQGIRYFAVEY